MEQKTKVQWTWVTISRIPKKVSRSTCKDFGIQVFMDGFIGARVFFCKELAKQFRSMLALDMKAASSYDMRIVSDEDFMRECEEYLNNKLKQ